MEHQPHLGYRTDWLLLPKRHIGNQTAITNSLQAEVDGEVVKVWHETRDHLVIPREAMSPAELAGAPFEIVDLLPDTFPTHDVQPTTSLYPVQEQAVGIMAQYTNGVLALRAGGGKTRCALELMCLHRYNTLVVLDRIGGLGHQWKDAALKHTDLREQDIGWIQGSKMDWGKPLVIASLPTLVNRIAKDELPPGFREWFGLVVYDEVHHLGARGFIQTAHLGLGARVGLSATPQRADGLDPLYQAHIGPVRFEFLEQPVKPDFYFVRTDISTNSTSFKRSCLNYAGEINDANMRTWLCEHPRRNRILDQVIEGLLGAGREVLVLTDRIEHVNSVADRWSDSGYSVGRMHADIKGADRQSQLQDNQLVVATARMAREGLDKQTLSAIILYIPYADDGFLYQVFGRAQRELRDSSGQIVPGAKTAKVFVFEDNIGRCRNQCAIIRSICRRSGYPINIVK